MSRRHALLVSAAVLSPLLITACGDSGSTPDPSTAVTQEVPVVADTFELSADRADGSTILTNDDDTVAVAVPDSALPAGLDASAITATVDRLVATDIGTGIEFSLGPDGTEFSEPVTLTFVADWDPEGTVTVTAVADDGTNLLPTPEDADEVLKTLQVVPNDDGTSTVSVEVDHFSSWSFAIHGPLSVIADNNAGFLIGAQSGVEGRDLYVIAGSLNSSLSPMKVSAPKLCAELIELEFRGATSSRSIASHGRKCDEGNDPSVEFWFPYECIGPEMGTASGVVNVQYGLAGLSPFALLVVLAGGEELAMRESVRKQGFWANASDALLYMRAPFSEDLACLDGASTTTSSTVQPAPSTTTAQPTTTSRGTVTGSPRPTPTPTPPAPGPTPPTPPTTTAATTTTAKATTTTKPRQGATTTLPRPTTTAPRPVTGGTTTLP